MKKYVIVGAGGRALNMYAIPLYKKYREHVYLAGVYDICQTRAKLLSDECGGIPVFDNFGNMLKECEPDAVIVTSMDSTHHEYIIRSLEAGCDVITEKPMTIDAPKIKAILNAEKQSGKKVTVTFNCRFMPYVARVKELLAEGIISEIYSIDFEWMLDTDHGADYFRRWHRYMKNSGGLLVHKATHHFDMINWWLDDEPEEVFAFGTKRFYGRTGRYNGDRCFSCEFKDACEFYKDITANELDKKLYFKAEKECSYIRDRCVFSPDIDIFDTMSVNAKYSKGALLSYSLIAHSPYEGWKVSINGANGRIEAEEFYSGHHADEPTRQIRIFNRQNEVTSIEMMKNSGAHGGGDERLLKMLFCGDLSDPMGQMADSWAGAMSVMIGASANISIRERKPVNIRSLLEGVN